MKFCERQLSKFSRSILFSNNRNRCRVQFESFSPSLVRSIRQMFPKIVSENVPNNGFAYSKLLSQIRVGCYVRIVGVSNLLNHIRGKFSGIASRVGLVPVSSLVNAITGVLFVSSKPKVVWPNAAGIVAMMQDVWSFFWNRSVVDYPRNSMSMGISTGCSAKGSNSTVSKFGSCRIPYPASVTNRNLLPESENNGFGKTLRNKEVTFIVRPLDQVHVDWVTLWVMQLTPGHFHFPASDQKNQAII